MKITGENILQELDNLKGKAVRILTVQEEEVYGAGYKGVIKDIKKEYWEKGHYNVYRISIDVTPFEQENRMHDDHQFNGKAYMDMDFYTGELEYNICTKYGEYKLEFEEDEETEFFEVLEKERKEEKKNPRRMKKLRNNQRHLHKGKRR